MPGGLGIQVTASGLRTIATIPVSVPAVPAAALARAVAGPSDVALAVITGRRPGVSAIRGHVVTMKPGAAGGLLKDHTVYIRDGGDRRHQAQFGHGAGGLRVGRAAIGGRVHLPGLHRAAQSPGVQRAAAVGRAQEVQAPGTVAGPRRLQDADHRPDGDHRRHRGADGRSVPVRGMQGPGRWHHHQPGDHARVQRRQDPEALQGTAAELRVERRPDPVGGERNHLRPVGEQGGEVLRHPEAGRTPATCSISARGSPRRRGSTSWRSSVPASRPAGRSPAPLPGFTRPGCCGRTSTCSRRSARPSSGRRSPTCCSTARPPTSAQPRRRGSPSAWAPTGHRRAARASWASSRWRGRTASWREACSATRSWSPW